MELRVRLNDTLVGFIRTEADGRNEFVFAREYLAAGRRPVLGQYFEDHLHEIHRSQTNLPPFFSALLPEAGLRELVARRARIHPSREAALIAVLGKDLPGAVMIEPTEGSDDDASQELPGPPSVPPEALRFSLAGAQLKFSVLYRRGGRGPTLPIDGAGGNWIAKFPSETYGGVPETEYAVSQWAGRAGITIPDVALVSVCDIENLPLQLDPQAKVFLSRRFDRPDGTPRIHQEDFSQIKNVRRDERYGTLGYASLAGIVRSVAGEDDFDEVIRRLVFNIIIGNGDAHLKNWSLVYPDQIHARLSPAYDLVPTVVYIPGDKLALKLARENRFDHIDLTHFEKLAIKVGISPVRVTTLVRDTVQRVMDTWPAPGQPVSCRRSGTPSSERMPVVSRSCTVDEPPTLPTSSTAAVTAGVHCFRRAACRGPLIQNRRSRGRAHVVHGSTGTQRETRRQPVTRGVGDSGTVVG